MGIGSFIHDVGHSVSNIAKNVGSIALGSIGGVGGVLTGTLGGALGTFGALGGAGLAGMLGGGQGGPLPQMGQTQGQFQSGVDGYQNNLENLMNMVGQQQPSVSAVGTTSSSGGLI